MVVEDGLTEEERAQVVKLLRCAADLLVSQRPIFMPIATAAEDLDWTTDEADDRTYVFDLACEAVGDLGPYSVDQLLEAAQRVEEGSWP
jgi:hypothetical protein